MHNWYIGIYFGMFTGLLTIANLIVIPFIHFYERTQNIHNLKILMAVEILVNVIYLIDLILMLLIFGFKVTLFKKSWGLRIEFVILLQNLGYFSNYLKLFNHTGTFESFVHDYNSLYNYVELACIVRLSRIFIFLYELDQWKFFMKAIKIMRIPFLNLVFTLYSLLWIFSVIGIEVYGGLISSEFFTKIADIREENDIADDYIWLNFNDYASGLITLQTMMLFNNWQFVHYAFVLTKNSDDMNG